MNVSLTVELENLVNEKVQFSMYHSASEVIREGLRLLKEQDEVKRLRLEEVRREVMLGVEQVRNGQYTVYESPEALAEAVKNVGGIWWPWTR